MKNITVNTTREVTPEELDNILDAALNWCSYWCDELSVATQPKEPTKYMSEFITRGGTLRFKIDEPFDDSGQTNFVLTKAKFVKGLRAYGNNHKIPFNFDDYDGPEADAVLQLALFKEVVYG